jgi:hypothetical protein
MTKKICTLPQLTRVQNISLFPGKKNFPFATAVGGRVKESASRNGPAIRVADYQPGLYSTQSAELFESCLTGTNASRSPGWPQIQPRPGIFMPPVILAISSCIIAWLF